MPGKLDSKLNLSNSSAIENTAGSTPDFEVQLLPSWLVFSADDNYRIAQYACFKVRNRDPVPIVYRLRTKERSFPRFSVCHGYLEPNEENEITVLVPASENWPRDPAEFAGRRHKVMVENLTVPADIGKPAGKKEAYNIAVCVFKATPPLTRMYTKLNILLPKITEEKSLESTRDA